MTIARSIPTRITEAVYTLLFNDADLIAAMGGDTSRIRLAHAVMPESSIAAPQINVALVPLVGWDYRLGSVSDLTVPVRVTYWVALTALRGGSLDLGEGQPIDTLWHIIKLIEASGTNQGRLEDPDAAVGADGVDKWLNHVMQTPQWGVDQRAQSAVGFYIDLVFESRQSISGTRA